jgi:polyisoprenoid-binding protein YceI
MVPVRRLLRVLAGFLLVAAGGARLQAEPVTYVVDPAASHVRVHLRRAGLMRFLGHDHDIEAPVAEGRIEVMDDDPVRSTVALRFLAARLGIVPGTEPAGDIRKVEERMRGPEVLDVARYPEIAFTSTEVRSEARGGMRFRLVVRGTLALRGRSFPVDVPLEVDRRGAGLEARGGLSLDLRDVGIAPPSVAGVVKVASRFRLEFEIRGSARP